MWKHSKQILVYLLICLLSLSSFEVKVSASELMFSGGSGTESDPFIVSNIEDFQNIPRYLGCYFLQINDISFSGQELVPIGTSDSPFSGVYNGNGYKLTDFSINYDGSTENNNDIVFVVESNVCVGLLIK